jgi:hypothetical protein
VIIMVDYTYVFTSKNVCPNGFTAETTWVDKGIIPAISSLKTTSGAFTHLHSLASFAGATTGSTYYDNTSDNYTIDPIRYKRVLCKISQTTYDGKGLQSFFIDANNCPTGYRTLMLSGYYIAVGNAYEVNSDSGHTHSVSGITTDTRSTVSQTIALYSTDPVNTSATTLSAPYVRLKMCIKE